MGQEIIEQRAGGIVFRCKGKLIEYLLVTSNFSKNRWIIPAGHIEDGETPDSAAVREVMEEAGVVVNILADLGSYQYPWKRCETAIQINTRLFLMEYIQTVIEKPEGRQVQFFTLDQIAMINMWSESKQFLLNINSRVAECTRLRTRS